MQTILKRLSNRLYRTVVHSEFKNSEKQFTISCGYDGVAVGFSTGLCRVRPGKALIDFDDSFMYGHDYPVTYPNESFLFSIRQAIIFRISNILLLCIHVS